MTGGSATALTQQRQREQTAQVRHSNYRDHGWGRPMATETLWEKFQGGDEPPGVRDGVLLSWRRSRLNGVDPEHVGVPLLDADVDSHFARVSIPLIKGMAELLTGDSSCLALANAHGTVIWRWVSDSMLRHTLDLMSVHEGFCFDEEFAGTNGLGTSLETGKIAIVRGSEHFVQRFHDVTCVAAPVRHPISRRVVGAINLTCRVEHTNSLLAAVVLKLVEEVEAALLHAASIRERRLLDTFLTAQRLTTGPVAIVGEDLVIANPAAASLGLGDRDIWEEVRSLSARAEGMTFDVSAGVAAQVRLVREGSAITAAVLTVNNPVGARVPRRRPAAHTEEADPWTEATAEARSFLAGGPVAVQGEAGTGKRTVLRAALGDQANDFDARTVTSEGLESWTARLVRHLDSPSAGPIALLHADLLGEYEANAIAEILTGRPATPPIGLTITTATGTEASWPTGLMTDKLYASTVSLSPLRDEPGRIVALVQQELRRNDAGVTLSLDAMRAVQRYGWPGNVLELTQVTRSAAKQAKNGVIELGALPADVRAAAARHVLTRLERAEFGVISSVLHEHDGNKSSTAKELGISRTSLYAKLRSYRIS